MSHDFASAGRARLGAYALWQLRDFTLERAVSMLVVGIVLGAPIVMMSAATMLIGPGQLAPSSTFIVAQTVGSIAALFVFIAVNRIVSGDRVTGYYRFLFAKPVSVVAFYAQSFAVTGVGMLAVVSVLLGIGALFGGLIPVGPTLLYFAVVYVSMASIGFFLSTVTRFDGAILLGLWFGSVVLRQLFGAETGVRGTLVKLLPPVHRLAPLRDTLYSGGPVEWAGLLHLLGYGLLFFALGLVVLWRRSLAS